MPNEIVGVPPCPNCGAPLIPNIKCPSCGYNPKATSCERCGTRFDGDKCDLCGWSDKAPICRNCGADLTDNHIMLKTLEDKWVWKTCAYCGTPIEQWLYTILGEIEPYEKPYEFEGTGHSGSLIGNLFGIVIIVVIASALFPTVANLTTGITMNHTGFAPNANITSSIQKPMITLTQIIPVAFGALILLMIYAVVERHISDAI